MGRRAAVDQAEAVYSNARPAPFFARRRLSSCSCPDVEDARGYNGAGPGILGVTGFVFFAKKDARDDADAPHRFDES